MDFNEIIAAAIEESGVTKTPHHQLPYAPQWTWGGSELTVLFAIGQTYIKFYWHIEFLFILYPTELLDPNWSSKTLAKRINDRIVEKFGHNCWFKK